MLKVKRNVQASIASCLCNTIRVPPPHVLLRLCFWRFHGLENGLYRMSSLVVLHNSLRHQATTRLRTDLGVPGHGYSSILATSMCDTQTHSFYEHTGTILGVWRIGRLDISPQAVPGTNVSQSRRPKHDTITACIGLRASLTC
mgnify:CR=1 FL=1